MSAIAIDIDSDLQRLDSKVLGELTAERMDPLRAVADRWPSSCGAIVPAYAVFGHTFAPDAAIRVFTPMRAT